MQIAAGKVSNTTVPIPNGTVSINALPWADVTVDGRAIGTTPLANISLPIGTHEVVFQHPQLGEKRQSVQVKANTPSRIGIDLTK